VYREHFFTFSRNETSFLFRRCCLSSPRSSINDQHSEYQASAIVVEQKEKYRRRKNKLSCSVVLTFFSSGSPVIMRFMTLVLEQLSVVRTNSYQIDDDDRAQCTVRVVYSQSSEYERITTTSQDSRLPSFIPLPARDISSSDWYRSTFSKRFQESIPTNKRIPSAFGRYTGGLVCL
jgi:hypothetical protein